MTTSHDDRSGQFRRRPVSRRAVVRGGLAAGAVAASGVLLPGQPFAQGGATPVASPVAGGATPVATPVTNGATPAASPIAVDGIIHSSVTGVPNAYTRMPAPFQSVASVPGSGGKVRMLTISYAPPPTAKDENTFWQELERRLGVEWAPELAPASSYPEKATTTIAGGDIPELFYLLESSAASIISQSISQGAFTDLTPYLEGAALADYPNLSLIPAQLWENVRIEGKIYGVPKPVLRSNNIAFYRSDWATTLGFAAPRTTDDVFNMFLAMAQGDPDGNGSNDSWGIAGYGGGWNMFLWKQMFRTPYIWRLNADGTLTNEIETDEFRQALDFAQRLYAADAYHPDTAGMLLDAEVNGFKGGSIGLFSGGFATFFGAGGLIDEAQKFNPNAIMAPLVPVGPDGNRGVTFAGQGYFGSVGIPASVTDEGRVRELLRIMDYLSAPFGSEESNFLRYGLTEHHDVQPDGTLVKNDKGRADISALVYPFLSEDYFFYPGHTEDAQKAQVINEQMAVIAVTNPAAGIASPASTENAAALTQLGTDSVTAMITGRESMDSLQGYINEWKSRGGDQVRQELEDGIRARQGG